MSNCGNCRQSVCSCVVNGDGVETLAIGLGTSYQPYSIKRVDPDIRPAGSAYRKNSTQSITLNTDTAIAFDTSEMPFFYDMWDVSVPTRLTAPIGGLYLVGGCCNQGGTVGGTNLQVWVSVNGVSGTPIVRRTSNTETSGFISADVATLIRLNANDYIELYVRSNRTQVVSVSIAFSQIEIYPMLFANWMAE